MGYKKDIISTIQRTFNDISYFEENFDVKLNNPLFIFDLLSLALQLMEIYKQNERLCSRFIDGEIKIVKLTYPNPSKDPAIDILNGGDYKVLNITHNNLNEIVYGFRKCNFEDIKSYLIEHIK